MMADFLVLAVALVIAVGVVLATRPPKTIPMSQAVQWRVDAIPKSGRHVHYPHKGTNVCGEPGCGVEVPGLSRRYLMGRIAEQASFDGQGERL